MDTEIVILSEVSQTKKKYHMAFLIWGIYKEMVQASIIYKTETGSQTEGMNLWLPGQKDQGKGQLGSLGLTFTCYCI